MASIYDDIRAALEVKLSNIAGIPDIAYENVSYSPTTGVPFVQPKFIPVSRRPTTRGLNPQQRYDGVLRVFCYTPEGSGPAAADDLADKVIDAFEATTDISFTNAASETISVSVDYAERDNGFTDTPWYYVAVNIGWYLYK
jgi:hypothetical protein